MGILVWLSIILAEMLFLSNESMMTVAILSFTFSGMFLWCLLKGYAQNVKGVIVCIAFTFVWGILLSLDPYIAEHTGFVNKYRVIVFAGGVTSIFLLIGIYNAVNQLFRCKLKVEGTYLGCTQHGHGIQAVYTPQFQYKIGYKTYTANSGVTHSKRYMSRYEVNKVYPIWVDEQNPTVFVVTRKLSGVTVSVLFMGFLFLMTTIFMFCHC